jgi:hypothetical protein
VLGAVRLLQIRGGARVGPEPAAGRHPEPVVIGPPTGSERALSRR